MWSSQGAPVTGCVLVVLLTMSRQDPSPVPSPSPPHLHPVALIMSVTMHPCHAPSGIGHEGEAAPDAPFLGDAASCPLQ